MMEKCFEIGTIQAFLDGELEADSSEKVARHVASCDSCALRLAEAEDETAFAFSALEQELNTLVPTQRLWTKINDSIGQNKSESVWQIIFSNIRILFANPSIAAFASLLIVAGIFAVVWTSRTSETTNFIARNEKPKQEIVSPPQKIAAPDLPAQESLPVQNVENAKVVSSVREAGNYKIVKADFVKNDKEFVKNDKEKEEENRQPNKINDFKTPNEAAPAYLPGEETYIKTIASLEKTVNSRKDEVLKPSARFSFEKDLAVADDAIDKMKTEVKKNPKNDAAKQVLLASYQNKVDLLNSVAEKNDLIASLR